MASREDKFQKIFSDVEHSTQIEENVIKFAERSQAYSSSSKRYIAKKSGDSKVVSITPKLLAERKKGLSKYEAKRLKVMTNYQKQLKKVEAKEEKRKLKLAKQTHKYQDKLDKRDKKKQLQEEKRNLKLAKKEEKQEASRQKKTYKKVKKAEKKAIKKDKGLEREKVQLDRMNKILSGQEGKKRLTTPKKRNIFTRLHHMRKYVNSDMKYEVIAEDIKDYKAGKLSEEYMESQWDDIQEYEDAKADIVLKSGWIAFKTALAGVALAGSIFACKTMVNDIQNMKNTPEVTVVKEDPEMEARRAKNAMLKGDDQEFFYEYTNGNPTVENWENLPEEIKQYVRNPSLIKNKVDTKDERGDR